LKKQKHIGIQEHQDFSNKLKNKIEFCPLCERELGDKLIDRHHLVPKTFGGKDLIELHRICHRKIHATFSERELLNYYFTIDRIKEHSEIQKFIVWVKKKPIDYYSGSDETNARYSKRRVR
jgi:5-methylcytosine-specific restriction endonuclease McrA